MLVVYYLVFKEAMKQKQNMERMNNIRSLPVTNRTIKNSFESDKTTQELLEQSNSSDEIAGSISGSGSTPSFTGGAGGGPRPHTISPSELEHLAVTPIKTNTTSFGANPSSIGSSNSLGPGPGGKRISLETAMMDARIKARNSIFVTSGTNIIEGDSKGFSSVSYCKQLYSLERAKASQHLLEEGTQSLRDAGGGDGHLPDLLAPLLHLVPDLHHLRRCLRGPGGGGCGPFLDWWVSEIEYLSTFLVGVTFCCSQNEMHFRLWSAYLFVNYNIQHTFSFQRILLNVSQWEGMRKLNADSFICV